MHLFVGHQEFSHSPSLPQATRPVASSSIFSSLFSCGECYSISLFIFSLCFSSHLTSDEIRSCQDESQGTTLCWARASLWPRVPQPLIPTSHSLFPARTIHIGCTVNGRPPKLQLFSKCLGFSFKKFSLSLKGRGKEKKGVRVIFSLFLVFSPSF